LFAKKQSGNIVTLQRAICDLCASTLEAGALPRQPEPESSFTTTNRTAHRAGRCRRRASCRTRTSSMRAFACR